MNERKKPGPAPLPAGKARSVLVGLRVTPAELEQIDKAAERAGQFRSEWIRAVILREATA